MKNDSDSKMKKSAFQITFNAIYDNDDVEPEFIADSLAVAMRRIGCGLMMVNVESVKNIRNVDKLLNDSISTIANDTISRLAADDGAQISFEHVDKNSEKK